MSLDTFQRFFQPGSGSLWSFQSTHLAGYVSSEGGKFRFTGADARNALRDELLSFLQRAAAVSQAFFPDASGTMHMPFRVRVRGAPGYSMTTFRFGSRDVQYDSGEERWVSLDWPGAEPEAGVALSVTPYQGTGPRPLTRERAWGLFMILQPSAHAEIFERTSRQLSVGYRPKASQNYVMIDFASEDPRSPLLAVPFTGGKLFPLSVPSRITHSGSGCAGAR